MIAGVLNPMPAAVADEQVFYTISPQSTTFPSGINPVHKMFVYSMALMKSDLSKLEVRVGFASLLNDGSLGYTGYGTTLFGVSLSNFGYPRTGDLGDYWIEAPMNYQGSTRLRVPITTYIDPKAGSSGGRKNIPDCYAETWLEPGASVSVVAFSIDRVCAEIPDLFYLNTFIDSNRYSSSLSTDYKYGSTNSLYVNLTQFPRPPKMKNQTISFVNTPSGTQSLDNPVISAGVYSSEGAPINVRSLSEAICSVSTSGTSLTISLKASGTCSLEASSPGTATVNPSSKITWSFAVNPKTRVKQQLRYSQPTGIREDAYPFDIKVWSDSGLPVELDSVTWDVCEFLDPSNPFRVTINGPGTCEFHVWQDGNDSYLAADGYASFYVSALPKPTKSPTAKATPTKKPSTPKPTPSQKTFGGGGSAGGGTNTGNQGGGTIDITGGGTTKTCVSTDKRNPKPSYKIKKSEKCAKGFTVQS